MNEILTPNLYTGFYRVELAIFHLIVILIFTLYLFFPYWLQTYIPVILQSPFQPLYLMIGFHCLCVNNIREVYAVFHLIFSMLSICSLSVFIAEYFGAIQSLNQDSRFNGTYCYSAIYGCTGGKTNITSYYALLANKTDGINSQAWVGLQVFVYIMLFLSIIHMIFAFFSLYDYGKNDYRDKLITKTRCSEKFNVLTAISIICIFNILICIAQIVLGFYLLTTSTITLNPFYYNSSLAFTVSAAAIFVPRPRKCLDGITKKIEGGTYKVNGWDPDKSKETEEFKKEPLDEKSKLMADFIGIFIIFTLILNLCQLSYQDIWLRKNNASLLSYTMETSLLSELTFNFTNVRAIKYTSNTLAVPSIPLQTNTFATFTIIYGIFDIIITISMGFLFGFYAYYLRLVHWYEQKSEYTIVIDKELITIT